jgi:hypothetical protein
MNIRFMLRGLSTLFLWFVLFSAQVKAIAFVEYTSHLNECMHHMAALRLRQANLCLQKEAALKTSNIALDYLNHYHSFFQIMVQFDRSMLPAFEKQNQAVLKKIELLPETTPYKLFYKASVHLQSAIVKGAFNEYLSAAWDFRSAFQEVNLNEKKFPNFLSHKKELGTLMALLGSFPPQYNWILQAVGLKGDFNEGLEVLKNYLHHSHAEPLIEKQQASIIYALIQLNFGRDRQTAIKFYEPYSKDYASNLMQCFVRSYIELKTGENDLALKTLRAKPLGEQYEQIPYLDFMMGDLLLHRLDQSAAIWYKKYITFSKTKHSLKEAYQKLSWLAWLTSDTSKFVIYHDLMQKNSKDAGSELKLINADLSQTIYPSLFLLQARLLFDGGYYEKALQKMKSIPLQSLVSKYQYIEFYYRTARIYQELNKPLEAIQFYKNCLDQGKNIHTYLLPNACLQLGLIYEKLNYKALAKYYYEQVSTYSGIDYESSLKQKAKTNIWRLNE